MNDNNINPEMNILKLDDDDLDKVSGGKSHQYSVVNTGIVPVYEKPTVKENYLAGTVCPNSVIIAYEHDLKWLKVPYSQNTNKLYITDIKKLPNYFYIEARYLSRIEM
ncbi:MAG: hypothetical protein K5985_05910 [Lachnospiraceae bacterium]|nr:hypothetical protein [Lachnospiraceae bacterium]